MVNMTVWHRPTVVGSSEEAVLLLDEIDLASNKDTLVLQPVLGGKGLFLKEDLVSMFHPKAGFNVIANSKHKGKGS